MSDVEHTTEVVDDQETDQVLQQVKFKKQKMNLLNNSKNMMKISHEMLKFCTNFRHSFLNQHDKINVTMYNQGSFSSTHYGGKKGTITSAF